MWNSHCWLLRSKGTSDCKTHLPQDNPWKRSAAQCFLMPSDSARAAESSKVSVWNYAFVMCSENTEMHLGLDGLIVLSVRWTMTGSVCISSTSSEMWWTVVCKTVFSAHTVFICSSMFYFSGKTAGSQRYKVQ